MRASARLSRSARARSEYSRFDARLRRMCGRCFQRNQKAKGKYNRPASGEARCRAAARDTRRVTSRHFRSGSADVTRSLPPPYVLARRSFTVFFPPPSIVEEQGRMQVREI